MASSDRSNLQAEVLAILEEVEPVAVRDLVDRLAPPRFHDGLSRRRIRHVRGLLLGFALGGRHHDSALFAAASRSVTVAS